jgi:RNA 2',3'-cyclic 3'-phosphodiesterase
MTRAFIALDLPQPARNRLSLVAARALLPPNARIVAPEALHLTLAFLGDQNDATLLEVHEGLSRLPMPEIALRFSGIGMFGGAEGRSLHVEVAPDPALTGFERTIRRLLHAGGLVLERRRFLPHITIARFPPGTLRPEGVADLAARLGPPDPTPILVEGFALYESHLTREGARYTCLARYLRG